jgi:hypothetical protein
MGEVQLFVVRVWRHLRQFRASVRAAGEEEPRLFREPAQLAEFLRRAAEESSVASDRADAADDADSHD